MFAVAVHVVVTLAVGHEQSDLVVYVVLQVTASLDAPDVGVNLKRRVDIGSIISRIDPQIAEAFAVPIVVVEAAARTIRTTAGRLSEHVVDHAAGLLKRRRRKRAVGNHFAIYRVGRFIRSRRRLNVRHFGIGTFTRFYAGVVVCRIVHLQFPLVGVLAGFGIFGFKHVRTSVNAPDLEGIRIALRIVR